MKITLAKVKTNKRLSEETICFSADLHIDDKKVAEVSNRGHGDPILFSDFDVERKINEYAATLPPAEAFGMTFKQTAEMIVSDLVADYEFPQELKRKSKNKTLIILSSTPKDAYEIINARLDDRMRAHLKKQYGDKLVEIINDRFTS